MTKLHSNTKAPAPNPSDFYNVAGMLTEGERGIQQRVALFVDEKVLPIISDAFDQSRFPKELVSEFGRLGLLGCNLEGYGCAGWNHVSYGLACQEIERGDSGLRSFMSVQGSLSMWPIHKFGSEQQKERWLPAMARGEAIGCFGLTEPEGGSDPGTMRTHAVRQGGDWILNGKKRWITNGTIADLAIVWAGTDDGVRGFIVERGMPGFTARNIEKKYSLRASVSAEFEFQDVRIPEANRLPLAKGLGAPLACLNEARYGITWGVIGASIACFEEARDYVASRTVFGRQLDQTQTIQRRLADMARRITLARLLSLQLGRLKDAGEQHHTQVSLAKWNNVRAALDIARDARDILGANGVLADRCAIRHMLNLESVVTYEGTETIHELVVGRQITGHAAF